MRCINCGIATQRLRRHLTSSLPALLLMTLARRLTIKVPRDANICHPCYERLNSAEANDARLFGHTMLCITCGRSMRTIQNHRVERNDSIMQNLPISHPAFHQITNFVCHPCWMRHQRQTNQDQNRIPQPGNVPQAESEPEPMAGPEPEPLAGFQAEPGPIMEPEPAPRPVREPELNLPNYKRAANTSRHCVFNGCKRYKQFEIEA